MKGSCRAATFLPNLDYIKRKKGLVGENEVMEKMKEKGYDIDFRKMKKMDEVPIEIRKAFLLSVSEAFDWHEDELCDMGNKAVQVSFILKHFIGLFMNTERLFKRAPEIWSKHYTVGRMLLLKYKEGEAVLGLEDFDVHPLVCVYLSGFFAGMGNLAKVDNIKPVNR